MPELIAGGPTIPARLLNELDNGRVAFFCGAGISKGQGSGLPDFKELVEHVYDANHIHPESAEIEALDLSEPCPDRRRPNYDKALGLLEGRLGFRALRGTVINQLSLPPKGELPIHKALIDLSRNEQGIRLITTNFDNRFVEAGLDEGLIDAAPKLPVPKPHTWSTLVHLHGRITLNEDGSNLVLTAADFGRAYLTERWAARFVTEVFREFTVVFVGYSVGDPVMSYMVDALAAERARGARFGTAYAFAGEDGSETDRSKARSRWSAKNIEPILYDRRDDHNMLVGTLTEWARIRKDSFHARSRIAINEMTKMPVGPDDPVTERVVWALQDPVAAEALAKEPPVKNEEEYGKFEKWLDMFVEKGLLDYVANGGEPDSEQNHSTVRLVDDGTRLADPNRLDRIRGHLAFWIARHLHVPHLLAWVLRNGGHLHPGLRDEIRRKLVEENTNIPERLRLLWTVLLNNRPTDHWKHIWTSKLYKMAASDAVRRQIEDDVIQSIAPHLVVVSGPPPNLVFQQYIDGKPISLIDTCGHLKLVSGDDDSRYHVKEIIKAPDVLSRHAETLTGQLEQVLDLGEEDDTDDPFSIWFRPSIADHQQNRDYYEWDHLISLVRDSYLALAAANRRRAGNLLLRWVESRNLLFRRLALHALTENLKSDIHLARQLILTGRKPGLWEPEMRREVLRFFRLAGRRLPRKLRVEIVRAIHVGPKLKKDQSFSYDRARYEIALRIYKLGVSGAQLDKKSRALIDEVGLGLGAEADEARTEFSWWRGEAEWIGDEEFAPEHLIRGTVGEVATALKDEMISQDGLRGLILEKRVKVLSALRQLAEQGEWPARYWQGLLWHLPIEKKDQGVKLYFHVARILAEAPESLFNQTRSAAASFLERLSDMYEIDQEAAFKILWTKAWIGKGEGEPQTVFPDDPLTDALNDPAGRLAEAAVIRLQKYKPETGSGIPANIRGYFDAIGGDSNGGLGRVMLARNLYYLFVIDPSWTTKNLTIRLDPQQSQEAENLWSAYSWSQRLGPNLLKEFKESFLEILKTGHLDNRKLGRLRDLFLLVCLEAPEALTEDEIRSVVEKFSEDSLIQLLRCLKKQLGGETAEQEAIWQDKVYPWLSAYWPREVARNTTKTSDAILDMIAGCGDAFPEAAKWALEFLQPTECRALYWFDKNNLGKRCPDLMLEVLDQVVKKRTLSNDRRYLLRKILDTMESERPELTGDFRFQQLYSISAQ